MARFLLCVLVVIMLTGVVLCDDKNTTTTASPATTLSTPATPTAAPQSSVSHSFISPLTIFNEEKHIYYFQINCNCLMHTLFIQSGENNSYIQRYIPAASRLYTTWILS